MLKDKLVALIKTMPRELRVKFVPAPTSPTPYCRT
jgi:hypothetical protein